MAMTKQYLSIDGTWNVLLCYDVQTEDDLREVLGYMLSLGASDEQVRSAAETLGWWNGGITFSSFDDRMSVVAIGRAVTDTEFYNTIDHEIDHIQDHVANYYGVRLGTEEAAYLQGYIGGRVWKNVIDQIMSKYL